jgi:hypothetical protein
MVHSAGAATEGQEALRYIGGERPLLTTVFKTDGRGIFVEQMGALVDATRGGRNGSRHRVTR